jgi:adenosylcobinamide-phosphate synthase
LSTLTVFIALLIDRICGEPKQWHPLVGFGNIANTCEGYLNKTAFTNSRQKVNGIIALVIAVLPIVGLFSLISSALLSYPIAHFIYSAVMLYVAVGWHSLIAHANAVIKPLTDNRIDEARLALSMIVSRDTAALDETEIAKAATESVLENGADAIFAAIFWFCMLGVPGVVLYRLSNTLDAMWGYKNNRFLNFGWAAARLDDLLNFIPARLTALSYAVVGDFTTSLRCWQQQGFNWKSPNAGPVMAAGAGAINTCLGGETSYDGKLQFRPVLGPIESAHTLASHQSIQRAGDLVNKSLLLWLFALGLMAWLL